MKTNLLKILAVFFAFGIFTLTSCQKPDPDQQSAEDDARGGYMMADAFALGNDNAGDGGKTLLPDGMEVERFPLLKKVVITFTNCDYRGSVRNGIVNVQYVRQEGDGFGLRAFNLVITFDNYTIDNVGLEGTITTTFGGTYTIPEMTVVASNMKATFSDGKELTWSSNKTFKIIEGFDNDDIPNVVEVSGTVNGVNREGVSFNSVHSAVTIKRACEKKYPVSGTVTIESDNGTTIIDYGDGECDKIITISNNGVTITVTLD